MAVGGDMLMFPGAACFVKVKPFRHGRVTFLTPSMLKDKKNLKKYSMGIVFFKRTD